MSEESRVAERRERMLGRRMRAAAALVAAATGSLLVAIVARDVMFGLASIALGLLGLGLALGGVW